MHGAVLTPGTKERRKEKEKEKGGTKVASTWCLTSTKTIRLITDGEKGREEWGVGGWGGGGGEDGHYIPIATPSPPE